MNKFILLGFPRTGSTVIAGSIINHPEALFYGELFNHHPGVRRNESERQTLGAGWKFEPALDWGIEPCPATEGTHDYLNNFFSRKVPFKSMGFKLMLDQVVTGPNSDVWEYIALHSEIKIIRTSRDNLVESICSFVRASMTKRWHIEQGSLKGHRFVIPPHEFLTLFKRFENPPLPIREIDKTHSILDLDYEDISNEFSKCMASVYSFLDIKILEESKPRLKKIASMKPNEELVNYAELKKYFENTPYSKYFIY